MCAILGLATDKDNASLTLYNGLTVLQHRGQDAAGIATMRLKPVDISNWTAPKVTPSDYYTENVVDGTRTGYISIRRSFIIAKGRVGVN